MSKRTEEATLTPGTAGTLPPAGKRPWRQRGLRLARDLLLIFIVFLALSFWQNRDLLPAQAAAPTVTLTTPGGEPRSLGGRHSKSTLIYFFAPWCGVCKLSMANAVSVGAWLGGDRLSVLAVGLDYETPQEVADFVAANAAGADYALGDGTVRDAFKISAYPTYYVLDPEGRVTRHSVGYSTFLGMLANVWSAI